MNLFVDWLLGSVKLFVERKKFCKRASLSRNSRTGFFSSPKTMSCARTKLFSSFCSVAVIDKVFFSSFIFFFVVVLCNSTVLIPIISPSRQQQTVEGERINIMQQYLSFAILIYHHETIPVARNRRPRKINFAENFRERKMVSFAQSTEQCS